VRIVDGPDEVHRSAIAKLELGKRAAARRNAETAGGKA
jgi:acyl-CoA dehydrogenase